MSVRTKQRLGGVLAFALAGLAAYGGMMLSASVISLPRAMDSLSPLVGVVVFLTALILMLKGVDTIGAEQARKDMAEKVRQSIERQRGK